MITYRYNNLAMSPPMSPFPTNAASTQTHDSLHRLTQEGSSSKGIGGSRRNTSRVQVCFFFIFLCIYFTYYRLLTDIPADDKLAMSPQLAQVTTIPWATTTTKPPPPPPSPVQLCHCCLVNHNDDDDASNRVH